MNDSIEAYPLYWPEGRPRTRSQVKSVFKTTLGVARDGLLDELKRLGARRVVLSTNIPTRNDGLPYANAREPQDSGAAVYFEYKGRPMCFACDKYRFVRENIHAIEKTIQAIRGIERWGSSDMMERAFRGFTALPEMTPDTWSTVLGISINATEAEIDSAYREKAKTEHPDVGGTNERFLRLTNARNQARRARGYTA